jgi:hypothetical protein
LLVSPLNERQHFDATRSCSEIACRAARSLGAADRSVEIKIAPGHHQVRIGGIRAGGIRAGRIGYRGLGVGVGGYGLHRVRYWRGARWRRGYYGGLGYGWGWPYYGLGLGLGVAATDWGYGYPNYYGGYHPAYYGGCGSGF